VEDHAAALMSAFAHSAIALFQALLFGVHDD
jgi:hypothetical protein